MSSVVEIEVILTLYTVDDFRPPRHMYGGRSEEYQGKYVSIYNVHVHWIHVQGITSHPDNVLNVIPGIQL